MPILWRYLIGNFTKVAISCTIAFVAILLTMRLDEIAHFASLGAPISLIFLFSAYQIPYILPIAIPLSCLISSMIQIHRLSSTHELTALRACGFALRDLFAPLLLLAAFISLFNFWMISEVATHSHLKTNLLKSELRSINPLLLLNNKQLMRLKGLYFNALGPSHVGESASDVILAIPNKRHKRINLLIAKHLKASPSELTGKGVTLMTTSSRNNADEFDDLFIENMGESFSQVKDFSQLLQKKVWVINNDYLRLPLLLIRAQEQHAALIDAIKKKAESKEIRHLRHQYYKSHSEILKRISIAIAVFTFTLMGAAFGINISRRRNSKGLFIVIGLTILYLVCFFVAKGVDQNRNLTLALYMAPHLIIITASIMALRRATVGIE